MFSRSCAFLLFIAYHISVAYAQDADSVRRANKRISIDTYNMRDTLNLTTDQPQDATKSRKDSVKQKKKQSEESIYKDSTRLALEAITKRAVVRSLIVPGWGQLYNAKQWRMRKDEMKAKGIVSPKLWWITVPAIYGGFAGTALVFNFNQENYHWVLGELQYRSAHNDQPEDEFLASFETSYLITAKDAYRRNRDLCVLIGLGVYALNAIEAYVSGMFLRYDMDDVALRIAPSFQYLPGQYAYKQLPTTGIKISLLLP